MVYGFTEHGRRGSRFPGQGSRKTVAGSTVAGSGALPGKRGLGCAAGVAPGRGQCCDLESLTSMETIRMSRPLASTLSSLWLFVITRATSRMAAHSAPDRQRPAAAPSGPHLTTDREEEARPIVPAVL